MISITPIEAATVALVEHSAETATISPGTMSRGRFDKSTVCDVSLLTTMVYKIVPPVMVVPAVSTLRLDCALVRVVPLSDVEPLSGLHDGEPPRVGLRINRMIPEPFTFVLIAAPIETTSLVILFVTLLIVVHAFNARIEVSVVMAVFELARLVIGPICCLAPSIASIPEAPEMAIAVAFVVFTTCHRSGIDGFNRLVCVAEFAY